mmetsp:Transcript_52404/g.97415  ORF Transcript_52404/g.97415 Transcript_52404/m.97415 type:complete len:230 (+) Transcript_52404:552-1241(+)
MGRCGALSATSKRPKNMRRPGRADSNVSRPPLASARSGAASSITRTSSCNSSTTLLSFLHVWITSTFPVSMALRPRVTSQKRRSIMVHRTSAAVVSAMLPESWGASNDTVLFPSSVVFTVTTMARFLVATQFHLMTEPSEIPTMRENESILGPPFISEGVTAAATAAAAAAACLVVPAAPPPPIEDRRCRGFTEMLTVLECRSSFSCRAARRDISVWNAGNFDDWLIWL